MPLTPGRREILNPPRAGPDQPVPIPFTIRKRAMSRPRPGRLNAERPREFNLSRRNESARAPPDTRARRAHLRRLVSGSCRPRRARSPAEGEPSRAAV